MTQQQHTQGYRKLMLRRRFLSDLRPGPFFVPFIDCFRGIILPWFVDFVAPYKVTKTNFYTLGGRMLYWGAVLEK